MKQIRFFDPKKNINFVGQFKTAWIATGILIVATTVGLIFFGMPWGIDFLGGLEMQVKFPKTVAAHEIRAVLEDIGFSKNQVQQFGAAQNNEMLIRIESMAAINDDDLARIRSQVDMTFPPRSQTKEPDQRIVFDKKSGSQLSIWLDVPYDASLTDPFARKAALLEQRQKLAKVIEEKADVELRKSASIGSETADTTNAILADEPQNDMVRYTIQFAGVTGKIQQELAAKFGAVEIRRVDFVDSLVSRQLRTDGLLAVIYAILAIVIYIAIRFDIYFSPGAIFSLVNDTLGALLVFVFFRVEFDVPSIAALLTVIGYSVNNTVVIYDRIREILPNNPKKPLSYEEVGPYVNTAINETLSRTINSTLTTLLASIPICIFASGAIQNFATVLSVGLVVGAFSSAYVAPAAFLLAKKYIQPRQHADENIHSVSGRPTREERAKGVV